MSLLELSLAIHWPTVGWIGVGVVVTLAVAIVAVEVSGEIHRKRRIARRISAFSQPVIRPEAPTGDCGRDGGYPVVSCHGCANDA